MCMAPLITRTSPPPGRPIFRVFQLQTQLVNRGRKKAGLLMDTRLFEKLWT